jgi:hypothetical protein
MKKSKKRRLFAVKLAGFLLLVAGGSAFSGCDQVRKFLEMDSSEDPPDPSSQSHSEPATKPETYAAGGSEETTFVLDDGQWYETHIFKSSGTLAFTDKTLSSITADVLVVGGGGGAGGKESTSGTDFAGGGGAGGVRYQSDAAIGLTDGTVTVVVGTGGSGKGSSAQGDDGRESYIGSEGGPLTAKGGGGGGGGWSNLDGKPGGSGGGSGAGSGATAGTGGTATQPKAESGLSLGNSGGKGGSSNSTDAGGGGGGAGNAGKPSTGSGQATPGVGGAGWKPATGGGDYHTAWITEVLKVDETYELARGGRGGGPNVTAGNGVNYGDGGSGNGNTTAAGGNGHDGIVIIRFPR